MSLDLQKVRWTYRDLTTFGPTCRQHFIDTPYHRTNKRRQVIALKLAVIDIEDQNVFFTLVDRKAAGFTDRASSRDESCYQSSYFSSAAEGDLKILKHLVELFICLVFFSLGLFSFQDLRLLLKERRRSPSLFNLLAGNL